MKMNNITALEWFIEQLPIRIINSHLAEIAKAKTMEREQIKEAWLNGDNDSMYEPKQLEEQAEQYYKEKYGKQ